MIDFVNKYARNVHSQNGEDGITLEVLRRIGLETGSCCEIGGNDGRWMSNTALLIERGFSGAFVEADWDLYQKCVANWAHNPKVHCICSRVGADNVNAFVDDTCDVLSLDTDGSDFKIFEGLSARPKIVIVEVDSSIPPDVYAFNSDGGASYLAMLRLAYIKDYFLLCHTGNLILVDERYRHLFPEIIGDGLSNAELYFKRDWLKENAA